MNMILFGFKGCGKTHFGQLLAKTLNCSFYDTDHMIIEVYRDKTGCQKNIREIYQSLGQIAFRQLEKQMVIQLISAQNAVIAVGGGTVLSAENVKVLEQIGKLIYIKTSLNRIKNRGISHMDAPIEELYAERLPIYDSIKAFCIDSDILDSKAVLKELLVIAKEKFLHGF